MNMAKYASLSHYVNIRPCVHPAAPHSSQILYNALELAKV